MTETLARPPARMRLRPPAVATTLLERVDPAGFDLVRDFAWPMSITVITDPTSVDDQSEEHTSCKNARESSPAGS